MFIRAAIKTVVPAAPKMCPRITVRMNENINPKIQSSMDAAMLCKMKDRNQIKPCNIDGPLAFDNAISREAARIKKIESDVSGNPDILVCPDLVSGNILAKALVYLGNAKASGIVMGARIPIILTSRADSVETRKASGRLAFKS